MNKGPGLPQGPWRSIEVDRKTWTPSVQERCADRVLYQSLEPGRSINRDCVRLITPAREPK